MSCCLLAADGGAEAADGGAPLTEGLVPRARELDQCGGDAAGDGAAQNGGEGDGADGGDLGDGGGPGAVVEGFALSIEELGSYLTIYNQGHLSQLIYQRIPAKNSWT